MPKKVSEQKSGKKKIKPYISVIIPVHNVDRYIENCLDSILAQTLNNIEIICIDDGSEDNSSKILAKYKKFGIKVISLKKCCGQAHARNIGLQKVTGEYIGFVDADDFVDKTMFEKLYKKAKKENADIEMCEAKVFDDEEKSSKKEKDYYSLNCFPPIFSDGTFSPEDTVDFIEKISVTIWNKIYKTSFIKNIDVSFSDGYIYEDLPFSFEVYTQAEKIGIIREPLYFYRTDTENSTMTKRGAKVLDRVDMVEKTLEIFKKQKYYPKIKNRLVNWAIHDLFYRFLLIDSKYQKEYFFMMKKLFKSIDMSDVNEYSLYNYYYPYFYEILEKDYNESIKYFLNKENIINNFKNPIKHYLNNELNYAGYKKYKKIQPQKEKIENLCDLAKEKEKLKEKYRKEFEQEKEKLIAQYKAEIEEQRKMYSNMLKEQFNFQQKNLEKINSLKKK